MFYDSLFQNVAVGSIEKIAVNLEDLRTAYQNRVKPNLIRTTRSARKHLRSIADANKDGVLGSSFQGNRAMLGANMQSKDFYKNLDLDEIKNSGDFQVEAMRGMGPLSGLKEKFNKHLDAVIGGDAAVSTVKRMQNRIKNLPKNQKTFVQTGGDVGRTLSETAHHLGVQGIPKAKTPQGREALNRIFGLHEANEMQSYKNAFSRGNLPTFESHQGPQPMLNDVIIANTFKGKGADEVKNIIGKLRSGELDNLKDTLSSDPKAVKFIETLQSGGRINRHARKYLDRQYARLGLDRKNV